MLRLIVNKAKHHYNQGLEFADRGRLEEAIAEMKNALDLDHSMVNAHVVLGTLYAKKEMFTEARDAWTEALATDHRFEKAHDYLNKAENIDFILPTMARYRKVTQALTAAVVLLVVLVIVLLATTPEPRQIVMHEAETEAGAEATLAATSAPVEVEATEEYQALERALAGARQGQEQLESQVSELQGNIETLQQQIEQQLQQLTELQQNRLAFFERGAELAEELLGAGSYRAAADLATLIGTQQPPEAIQERLANVRNEARNSLLTVAREAIIEAPLDEATQLAREWVDRFPDRADEVMQALDERLAAEAEQTEQQIRAQIQAGELEAAREAMASMRGLYESVGRPVPQARMDEFEQQIAAVERQRRQAEVETAYEANEWERVIELTENMDALTANPEERARVAEIRQEALTNFASQMWAWYQELDVPFLLNSLSEEQAQRTVVTFELVLDNLPPHERYARGPILLYTTSAYLKLGQIEQARQTLAKLDALERVPDYIKPAIRDFVEKFGDELGIEAGGE